MQHEKEVMQHKETMAKYRLVEKYGMPAGKLLQIRYQRKISIDDDEEVIDAGN